MLLIKRLHLSILSLAGGAESGGGGDSHVISGPLGQPANLNTKKKRNPSVLAAAFQNAWKQGNLTAEVREGERREGGGKEGGRNLFVCMLFSVSQKIPLKWVGVWYLEIVHTETIGARHRLLK